MVTALHSERRDRVRVELDGEPWRTFPAAAVAAAGLACGIELDRTRARTLRRSARRSEALDRAADALNSRARSTSELDALLQRRGVTESERHEALTTLARFGYLDDHALALRRAALLAERGYGDQAIRADLERRELDAANLESALAALPPEIERARELTDGLITATLARRLMQKGFSDETIATLCDVRDRFADG